MISTDMRNLTASLKAHYHVGELSPGFFDVFVKRLHGLAEQVEKLEAQPVPAGLRGGLFDSEKVVSIDARRKPTLRLHAEEGGAA